MSSVDTSPSRRRREPNSFRGARIASGINIVFGIWLIAAPFMFRYSNIGTATWNDILVGLIVLATAWVRISDIETMFDLGWINFFAGIWLLVAPWAFGYSTQTSPMWNDSILGILILVVAAAGLFVRPRRRIVE